MKVVRDNRTADNIIIVDFAVCVEKYGGQPWRFSVYGRYTFLT